eukprot:1596332-Ditylum_brightwellii.AAC.1
MHAVHKTQQFCAELVRKRLAMLPEGVVKKTLSNCTNLYFNMEMENMQGPCQHFKYRFPGIRYPRQPEIVASDTFSPL